MSVTHLRWLALLGLPFAAMQASWAEEGDGLKFIGSVAVQYDSNLFRLSSSSNAPALIGRTSAAETIGVTTVGVNYSKAYSLQQVDLDVRLVKYDYQNFSYLDYSAVNYRANWRWSYTPHLYGNLIASREQTLNSFADFRGFTQRNERIDTDTRLEATYELDARWRILGSLAQHRQENRQPLLDESGYQQRAAGVGVRYVLPSESYVSFRLKKVDGSYSDRPLSAIVLFDTAFMQNEGEVDFFWAVTPKTTADFRVGYRMRRHQNFPQRDFDGAIGNAKFNWQISGKSALAAGWTRDTAAFQTATSNFAQTDRLYVEPVWQFSAKTSARLQLGIGTREYKGSPGATALVSRRDTYRDAGLSFNWQPVNALSFGASILSTQRSSNLPGLDFNSKMINLNAQFTF